MRFYCIYKNIIWRPWFLLICSRESSFVIPVFFKYFLLLKEMWKLSCTVIQLSPVCDCWCCEYVYFFWTSFHVQKLRMPLSNTPTWAGSLVSTFLLEMEADPASETLWVFNLGLWMMSRILIMSMIMYQCQNPLLDSLSLSFSYPCTNITVPNKHRHTYSHIVKSPLHWHLTSSNMLIILQHDTHQLQLFCYKYHNFYRNVSL